MEHGTIKSLLPLLLWILLAAACQPEEAHAELELQDFVAAYKSEGLSARGDSDWHGFEHAGATRGLRFSPYTDEPDKWLELYEYATVAERKQADRKIKEYHLRNRMEYDEEAALGLSRFSLYGHQGFEEPRRTKIVEAFRSTFSARTKKLD